MLDRKIAPPFVKTTSFQLPKPLKTKLANGVPLYQLGEIQQDIVKLEVVFDAGKWYEPKPGVSHFAAQMLEKGTVSKSSSQLAELFDQYGAHIEINSNFDFASVSLYALTKHIPILLPSFYEMITSPAYSQSELEQMKDIFIQGLRIKSEKTSYLASKLIRKNIFGTNHPYGGSEEESDVQTIEANDLHAFFKSNMIPTHLFLLGEVRDLDLNEIKSSFGSIACKKIAEPIFDVPSQMISPQIVDKPNSVQSTIRMGKKTISRSHPDYAKLLILNYYLGGFFGSRLMKNIREEKGLTYGISASINALKNECAILIGTDVNKENRELVVNEIKKEIVRLREVEIDDNDLQLAKRHFIGGLQSEIASPFSILDKTKNIILNQLPSDYYQSIIQEIDSVSAESLGNIAQLYFDENSFTQVIVG